jgi:hypothetical protein
MGKIGKNEKSLAGEFFTVAKLFYHGFIAAPTLGKTKHVDILVYDPVKDKRLRIEVKTSDEKTARYKTKPFGDNFEWIMDKKHEEIKDENLFYCFVLLRGTKQLPRFFVVPSKDVADYLKWEHEYWVSVPRKKPVKETSIRVFRVGVNDKKYEDNWDLLRR